MADNKETPLGSTEVFHRRRFFKIALVSLGFAALAEFFYVVVTFLKSVSKPLVITETKNLINAGHISQYSPDSVTAFVRGRFYLVCLEDGGFLAVSRKCTHLGCTVPWVEEKKQFICPCHASAFDIAGNVISPPAPRALDVYPIAIENGAITVDIGKTIQRKTSDVSYVVYDSDKLKHKSHKGT